MSSSLATKNITSTSVIKREPVFTRIPPEIWLIIFDLVTANPPTRGPAQFTPPFRSPALSAGHHTALVVERGRASIRHAQLRFVCRHWADLVAPNFWRVVALKAGDPPSCRRKAREVRTIVEAEDGPGPLVQELILKLTHAPLEEVSRILTRCTRLRSLIIEKHNHWDPAAITTSLKLPDSLEKLEYIKYQPSKEPFPREILGVLNLAPNVTSFALTHYHGKNVPKDFHLPHIAALQLHYVVVEVGRAIATWSMPRLTHLSILGYLRPEEEGIITHFGEQLTFLELPLWFGHFSSGWKKVLDVIKMTPNLTELVVATNPEMPWILSEDSEVIRPYAHPSVTHLGLKGPRVYELTPQILQRVMELKWPALRCVRLMEDVGIGQVGGLVPNSINGEFKKQLQDRGIVVEDRFGCVLEE